MLHPYQNPTTSRRSASLRTVPRGFTLVELLVVIVIMSILSSMVLMAMANTQASARDARTRSTITKLDALISAKWETYQTRRVPLKPSGTNRTNTANTRLQAIREMMRMELPDQHIDISTNQSALPARPAVSAAYLKRYNNASAKTDVWEGAECLYLIVAYGLHDPDALSQFNEAEIGDFDSDGLPEFLDGWGQPISFIRWAPEYVSPLHNTDAANHHDPFDPMRQDSSAYSLYPLIFSAGPDKVLGIKNNRSATNINKPYSDSVGNSLSNESLDNITNHELQAY
jgi:prepilin-type N-terminal cleavage/methylation domain-containing protein